jgi:outer membrane protein assembly factor BamB
VNFELRSWCERYYKRVPPLRTTIYSVVAAISLTSTLSVAQQPDASGAAADRIIALDPRWTVSLVAAPSAPPGFDQQFAYVPLEAGELLAINLDEGRVQWTAAFATSFTPATGDGFVFVAGDASVTALDQPSGRTLWQTPLPAPVSGPLHWESGWVFASTAAGDLIALHAQDGRILWSAALGSPVTCPPSASDDRLYAALRDGRLVALALDSGAAVWSLALEQDVTGVLALEDQVLAGTRANHMHSVSRDRGRIRWSQRAGADVIGPPAADDAHIYFVAFDNVLRALDRGNGNLRWRRNLPSRPSGGPLRIDDVVLVPFSTNDIGAYLAQTGAPSFTIQAVGELGAAPFLRDNTRPTAPRLIAISREGALQGFAPRTEPPPVPLGDLPGARVGG